MLPPPAWERALVASLEQLVRHAARPAYGVVSGNAEAVLFADYAELLACLAGDWCEGYISTRWWWQSLFKGVAVAHVVPRAWLDVPEYVPAVLQHLAQSGKAGLFARSLSSNEAGALVHNLTRRFALPKLQTVLEAVLDENRQATSSVVKAEPTTERERYIDQPSTVRIAQHTAPWQRWVPESADHGLGLDQQCLLGIGLMLQRAPTTLRTPSFASAVWQWRRAAPQPTSSRDFPVSASMVSLPAGTLTPEEHGVPVEIPHTAQGESAAPPTLSAQAGDSTVSLMSEQGDVRLRPQTPGIGSVIPPPGHSQAPQGATTPELQASSAELATSVLDLSQAPETNRVIESHIDTALGGLFYLINLGLFLHFYGDFTTPAHPGILLQVWDFVALLGQQLVGAEMYADPVWPLLAQLAGRDAQEAPGKGFDPPDAWRVPAAWLEPFSEAGLWHWEAAHGRLWVQHPEQFLVLDVPCDADGPLPQLQRELQAYSDTVAFELRRASLSGGGDGASPLERWIGWLMPYVRVRLQRALGVADTDELARLVYEHPARVCVTAAHLDIFLALETLPIAIRLAGLDRNPGWVPAAGRYIAFHFE
jgi:hypothetical protein